MNYSLSHISQSPQMIHCCWKHAKACVAFIQMTGHYNRAAGMKQFQPWNKGETFSWSGCLSDSTEYWVLVIEKQHIGINATSQILNPSQEVVTFTTKLCGYSCQLPKLPWTVTEASHSRFSSWSCTRITAWKFFSEFDDMKQVLFPV